MVYGLWNNALKEAKKEFGADYQWVDEDEWGKVIERAKIIMKELVEEENECREF